MRMLYNLFLYFLMPFVMLRLLWRSRRAPAYKKRWAERFGYYHLLPELKSCIWVHAVSVGEVLAVAPLVKELHKQYPQLPMVVTSMTPTGSERIVENLPDTVLHVYAPYDLPGAVQRFLKKTKPKLALFMETELWPNILRQCRLRQIPTALVNARLSEKSANGYMMPLVRGMTRRMMRDITFIAAQARKDAARFKKLGARDEQLHITGNMKFDFQLPASLRESAEMLRGQLGSSRSIWIAASTHEGEDEKILRAHKQICETITDALLVLVPRHPERFEKVALLCERQGFNLARRSLNDICDQTTSVYLGDTMGELRVLFGAVDVAFVGGSLVTTGGHNMLEPAAYAVPVLAGPHTFNFAETTELLVAAKGLLIVDNWQVLAEKVTELFKDPVLRHQIGEKAQRVVEKNRGALKKHMQLLQQILG